MVSVGDDVWHIISALLHDKVNNSPSEKVFRPLNITQFSNSVSDCFQFIGMLKESQGHSECKLCNIYLVLMCCSHALVLKFDVSKLTGVICYYTAVRLKSMVNIWTGYELTLNLWLYIFYHNIKKICCMLCIG
jgi:hypothetical protein